MSTMDSKNRVDAIRRRIGRLQSSGSLSLEASHTAGDAASRVAECEAEDRRQELLRRALRARQASPLELPPIELPPLDDLEAIDDLPEPDD